MSCWQSRSGANSYLWLTNSLFVTYSGHMPNRSSMPINSHNLDQPAATITNADADDKANDDSETDVPVKNPHAAALGRLGGKKGGPARALKLSAERRREIARIAAQARWHREHGSAKADDR